MKISELLKGQSQNPVVVSPQHSIVEAAKILAQYTIGVLVVVDGENNIAGVISERDIAYALGNGVAAIVDRTVADLMTSKIVVIRAEETVEDAIYVFKAGLFRHLVVADNGKPVGVVSIRDVVRDLAPLILEAKGRLDDQTMANFLHALSAA